MKILIFAMSVMALQVSAPASSRSARSDHQSERKSAPEVKDEQAAVLTHKPQPRHPKEASGLSAVVRVRVLLATSGRVTHTQVVEVTPEGLPAGAREGFIREATKAARSVKFKPAMRDGRPESRWVLVEYNFG